MLIHLITVDIPHDLSKEYFNLIWSQIMEKIPKNEKKEKCNVSKEIQLENLMLSLIPGFNFSIIEILLPFF